MTTNPGRPGLRIRLTTAATAAAFSALLALAPSAAAADTPAHSCPQRSGLVVCVDQDHQRLWVRKDSETIFGPVLVRTGAKGMHTPNGWFRVYKRREWPGSPLLPYSQFCHRGDALHGSYDDLHKGISKGCVNLKVPDAKRLWRLLSVGDLIYIWGHKPGT